MRKKSEKRSATKLSIGQIILKKPSKPTVPEGFKKQYLKSGSVCRVTFRLPGAAAPKAQMVTIVGDFNNWNKTEAPMKRLKNGDFKLIVKLPCNKEYKFKYLIDGNRWENDWCADKYVHNPYGYDDSVVVV